MSKLRELRKLFDKIFFILLCVVLLALFIMLKCWDFKFGLGPGNGTGTGNGQQSFDNRVNNQNGDMQQNPDSPEQKPTATPTQPSPKPSNIVKLFLGRQGVSEDKTNWRDADQFSGFLQQLKGKGVKEVYYVLLPDSIERYEEKWKEELKKAKLIYAELQNDIEADEIPLQP